MYNEIASFSLSILWLQILFREKQESQPHILVTIDGIM